MFGNRPADESPVVAQVVAQRSEARRQRDEARRQRDDLTAERDRTKKKIRSIRSQLSKLKGSRPQGVPQRVGEVAQAFAATSKSFKGLSRDLARMEASVAEAGRQLDEACQDMSSAQAEVAIEPGTSLLDPARKRFSLLKDMNHFSAERERRRKRPELLAKLQRGETLSATELECLTPRIVPPFISGPLERSTPPASVAFVTVANDRFFRGLEGLLLSLLHVYPDLESDVFIYHDGTLSTFAQGCLSSLYPRCRFVEESMDWFKFDSESSDNHKRVGKLGYMNVNALRHSGYSHVVVLDSDLLVLGDISELWSSRDAVRISYDAGDREVAAYSDATRNYIFNSGVISIPARFLGDESFREMQHLMQTIVEPICPLLDRFADQKAWNVFLSTRDTEPLPLNYNCNVKYVAKHLNGHTEDIRILHFAGRKPWLTKDYVESHHVQDASSPSTTYHELWYRRFRPLAYQHRLASFRRHLPHNRHRRLTAPDDPTPPACVLIGNGPSIAKTDLVKIASAETVCFNWFVLSEQFDLVRPDHLVLASHMFFGGWNTLNPRFPTGFLEALRAKSHRPVLWTSFYFKPYFEELGLHEEFEVNYLLFEKPFKRFTDRVGRAALDIDGFMTDGHTGVLTFGVPIARHLGFHRIVLVGCDSNYNRTPTGSNYFYDPDKHTSPSTRSDSLTATWSPDGAGPFTYAIVRAQLEEEGIELLDATVGGALRALPRISPSQILRPTGTARRLWNSFVPGLRLSTGQTLALTVNASPPAGRAATYPTCED